MPHCQYCHRSRPSWERPGACAAGAGCPRLACGFWYPPSGLRHGRHCGRPAEYVVRVGGSSATAGHEVFRCAGHAGTLWGESVLRHEGEPYPALSREPLAEWLERVRAARVLAALHFRAPL